MTANNAVITHFSLILASLVGQHHLLAIGYGHSSDTFFAAVLLSLLLRSERRRECNIE